MYAYVQTIHSIPNYWDSGGIAEKYSKIRHPRFRMAHLEKKEDVWQEFKRILGGSNGLES